LLYDKRISEKKKRQWKGKEGVEWVWGTTEFYVGNIKLGLLAWGQDPAVSIHRPFSYTNKLRLPAHFPPIAKF
jgi:hypothetical protein